MPSFSFSFLTLLCPKILCCLPRRGSPFRKISSPSLFLIACGLSLFDRYESNTHCGPKWASGIVDANMTIKPAPGLLVDRVPLSLRRVPSANSVEIRGRQSHSQHRKLSCHLDPKAFEAFRVNFSHRVQPPSLR